MCGRTLLRGERAEIYLAGITRHSVCELCSSRALHGGWVREGTLPARAQSGARVDRRRSLLRRRRGRRGVDGTEEADTVLGPPPSLLDDPVPPPEVTAPAPEWMDEAVSPSRSERRPRRRRSLPTVARQEASPREAAGGREPRHVRAVPTSIEHKIDAAIELFNGSDHPKTMAGITRSLGLPDVSVHPSDPIASIVNVVASWELCWYRYEVDLGADRASVRLDGQGYELSELSASEQVPAAVADDGGQLHVTVG